MILVLRVRGKPFPIKRRAYHYNAVRTFRQRLNNQRVICSQGVTSTKYQRLIGFSKCFMSWKSYEFTNIIHVLFYDQRIPTLNLNDNLIQWFSKIKKYKHIQQQGYP